MKLLKETSMVNCTTLERLHALQYGPADRVLLFTQDVSGLGSQIHRRVIGLKLALMLDRKVVFPRDDNPPYAQIFEPVHSRLDYAAAWQEATDYFAPGAEQAKLVRLDFFDFYNDLDFRKKVFNFTTPESEGAADPILFMDGMLLSFCHLMEEHQLYVKQMAEKLHVDGDTLGVHIRHGDKSIESPYVPTELYNEKIRELCAERGFTRVFASSDDPDAFADLIMPKGVELVFDGDEPRYNNANHRFLRSHPELVMQETQTGIKNIYLLGRCGAIVGQDTAQFGRLAAAQISWRLSGTSYGCLLDGRYVIHNSRVHKTVHTVKDGIRNVLRTLFPWLTLRYQKKKWYKTEKKTVDHSA